MIISNNRMTPLVDDFSAPMQTPFSHNTCVHIGDAAELRQEDFMSEHELKALLTRSATGSM